MKEQYWYLDSTPTHSYMKMLYKYPQRAFPYTQLVEENAKRDQTEGEYEILDTGVFEDNRYWDVFVEVRRYVCLLTMTAGLTPNHSWTVRERRRSARGSLHSGNGLQSWARASHAPHNPTTFLPKYMGLEGGTFQRFRHAISPYCQRWRRRQNHR